MKRNKKTENEMVLKLVKTNDCYFINTTFPLHLYLVNGKELEKANLQGWYISEEFPTKIEKLEKQPNINYRFILKEEASVFGAIELPKEMPLSEVTETSEYGSCVWKEEFEPFQSLYEKVSDPQPDKLVEKEFSTKLLLEVDKIEPYGIKYSTNIIHQTLDKLLFPQIVLPKLPCKLSSKESYDIVRHHVKNNINPKVARITSDYDFCFTVKKVIDLHQPLTRKEEILTPSGRSFKYKKYRDVYIKSRMVEVFEMTHSLKNYSGYTPLPGFKGESHEDLQKNIDKYLEDLMETINTPLIECPHCKGVGVVENNDNYNTSSK